MGRAINPMTRLEEKHVGEESCEVRSEIDPNGKTSAVFLSLPTDLN
jgi:hypothetical protein